MYDWIRITEAYRTMVEEGDFELSEQDRLEFEKEMEQMPLLKQEYENLRRYREEGSLGAYIPNQKFDGLVEKLKCGSIF